MYPTGQNYSLELMFANFVTAKNHVKLNPLKLIPTGAICLKTLHMMIHRKTAGVEPVTIIIKVQVQVWRGITEHKTVALPLSYKGSV